MFLSGEELKKYVDGIIHEDTQLAETGIDLTVDNVKKPTSTTELDFGGGEEKPGNLEIIKPEKRSTEDKYGWWKLGGGIYIIDLNEDISVSEGLGVIAPLARLTSGGSFHPPLLFAGNIENSPILYVSSSGLNLKENARLSRLMVWT